MKLVKLLVIFEVFRVCILIELAFSLKSFEQCLNYERKSKDSFHGHLTRFKFEELIDVKEIGISIFIFCS